MYKRFCLLFCFVFSSIKTEIILNKAFLHVGNSKDKLVFYFNENPKVNSTSSKLKNNIMEYRFLFPKIKISTEANKMINRVKTKNNFYDLKISKKLGDLEIKVIFNTKKVIDIEAYSFTAITSAKGVSINILHKPVSNKISKKNVIIDMGHGGKDKGAVGKSGIQEKDITYKIGIDLYNLLKDQGFNVYLTRKKDVFVDLDKRTSFANSIPGNSIFISIHANHSNNSNTCGIESYYLDYDLLRPIRLPLRLANARSEVAQGDRGANDFLRPLNKSKILCELLHSKLIDDLKNINNNIVDRKTKSSVSQVLLGTEMASVLIEVGFVSNKKEEKLLSSPEYIQAIAKSLSEGIQSYFSTGS